MIDRKAMLKAAEAANADFGQWMPQAWLDLFEKHYNADQGIDTPPPVSAPVKGRTP